MAGYNNIDPEVAASIKEAADREARAKDEREKREAEDRGELERVQVRKIVDAMDDFDGRAPFRDDVAEIVAKVEEQS